MQKQNIKFYCLICLFIVGFFVKPLPAEQINMRSNHSIKPEYTKVINILIIEYEPEFEKENRNSIFEKPVEALLKENRITVQQGKELALDRNLQVKVAKENVTQAVASYEETRANLNPSASANVSGVFQGPVNSLYVPPPIDKTFHFEKDLTYQANAQLQYLLTSFGKIENQVAAAFININTEKEKLETSRSEAVYTAKKLLFSVLQAQSSVRVAQDYIDSTIDNLEVAKKLYREGIVSRFDVVKAELEVSRAEQNMTSALKMLKMAKLNYLAFIDIKEPVDFNVLFEKEIILPETVEIKKMKNIALANRHEVKSMEFNLASARKLLKAARALLNPDLMLSANYTQRTETLIASGHDYNAMLTLNIPLWDGGSKKAQTKNANSVLTALGYMMENTVNQVFLDVEEAWLDIIEARANIQTGIKDVEKSREGYHMAQSRYRHGLSTAVEMEDALRTLNESEQKLVNYRYEYNIAVASLEKALGIELLNGNLELGGKENCND